MGEEEPQPAFLAGFRSMLETVLLGKTTERPMDSKFFTASRTIRSMPMGYRIPAVRFLLRSRPVTEKPLRYPSVNVSAISLIVSSGRRFKKAAIFSSSGEI